MDLKEYQKKALRVLREYLQAARLDGAARAYAEYARWEGLEQGVNYRPIRDDQNKPVETLAEVPYVCLRLPTGGGKTLLAVHTIAIAAHAYLEQDYPLVLWLVPTDAIRQQTRNTLNDPDNRNYQALSDAFGEQFKVLDITDFTQLRPQDIADKVCIVISTLANPRVKETEVRKVYAHNENLDPHFARVPEHTPGLERDEKGRLKHSFINLLALHRPLVLVDEAHNANTSLSFEIMQRINPACIIEFTATPAANSNVLYSVSAAELKAEDMIKLPIVLTEHKTWQAALEASIDIRNWLAQQAANEPDFIRPIVLIQAESKGRDVTVEVIKNYLLQDTTQKIAPEKIAVATGEQRELDGVNLMDRRNTIEYVITIQALKEGWDCPFAYVFCSVASVHSKKDVEQFLGRVLRMPYARARTQDALNRAYAHVSSRSWPQAVSQLRDRLVSMGFDPLEAEQFIQPRQPGLNLAGGYTASEHAEPLRLTISEPPTLYHFDLAEQANMTVTPHEDGSVELHVKGAINLELEQKLLQAVPVQDRQAVKNTIAVHRRQHQRPLTSAERGEPFVVPQLLLRLDGQLEPAEQERILDAFGWNLLQPDYPAQLSEVEFTVAEDSISYLIDIGAQQRLVTRYLNQEQRQGVFGWEDNPSDWDELQLSRKLDKRLRQDDIRQAVLLEFLRRTINYLVTVRRIPLPVLARHRAELKNALESKIKAYRQQAARQGYQQALFGAEAIAEVSLERGFRFDPKQYPAHWNYNGPYQFSKHFYPLVGELKAEGEEFECAKALDRLPQVKHWVRNLERQPDYSFWLPTATDRFYPDFAAELDDGRILVVEYKGELLQDTQDTREKQNVGALWEEKSHGKGLFLLVTKRDQGGRRVYEQLRHKVSQQA